MATITQLKPDQFSDARKSAMKEIYGENWDKQVEKVQAKVAGVRSITERRDIIADHLIEIVKAMMGDDNAETAVFSRAYTKLAKELRSKGITPGQHTPKKKKEKAADEEDSAEEEATEDTVEEEKAEA